jgi:hypothetical protein
MLRKNGTDYLPFMFNGIGRWWGANPVTKTQEEIDFIASADENAVFGECKWSSSKIGFHILEETQRKSLIFERYTNKIYFLFSKIGFNSDLETHAAETGVRLISLPELYEL